MAQKNRSGRNMSAKSHGGGHAMSAKSHGGGSTGQGQSTPTMGASNLTREDERFISEHQSELSKTTLRSKWIHSPSEHEDHAGQSLATRSHDVIVHWAEERGAQPATVPGTEHGNRPGVLRFNFPGYGGEALEEISWEEWFKTFDVRQLVFVFQEHKTDGRMSNFFQLDSPEREHD